MPTDILRPPILISEPEQRQLAKLARSVESRMPEIADELLSELERADICQPGEMPPNVVKMYSMVRFTTDKGTDHRMQLVYPEDSDVIRDRLSILSPIGTALIGLSEGQIMHWTDRAGQPRWLKVVAVEDFHAD